MKTRADELRDEIARVNKEIAWAEKCANDNHDHPESVELSNDYAAAMRKRKAQLEGYLEREEAQLVKPQPESVKAGAFDI